MNKEKLFKTQYLAEWNSQISAKEEYEKALRYLSDYNGEEFNGEKFANAIEDLDELINEYFELKEKHNKLIDSYTREYFSRKDSDFKMHKLEKALDKACELLEDLSRFTPKGSILRTKEKWKERFLRDE